MSSPNGYVNGKGSNHSAAAELRLEAPKSGSDDIAAFVTELEVPFDPAVIEWRVTNTAQNKKRGQVIPYADQGAYTDRLNRLFTPAGWTRRYTVHTSPNFERSKDHKSVAKVSVTCAVTIHPIGTHSATGEEWSDSDHAGTSAEAQAFKRACACFGLGRYLYYFSGIWVDLDDHKRPMKRPELAGWATPQGWRTGLRPEQASADGWPKESSTRKSSANRKRSSEPRPHPGDREDAGGSRQLHVPRPDATCPSLETRPDPRSRTAKEDAGAHASGGTWTTPP